MQRLDESLGAAGSPRRRLDHDDVACGERRCGLPCRDRDWKDPGRDDPDDTERTAPREGDRARIRCVPELARVPLGLAGVEAKDRGGAPGLAERVRVELAL